MNRRIPKLISSSEPDLLLWLKYLVLASVVLYFGRDIFIPLSYALLISFVMYPVCRWLETKGVGRLTAIIISIALLILIGVLLFVLLIHQFISFMNEWPSLHDRINQSLADLSEFLINVLGISRERQASFLTQLSAESRSNLFQALKSTISASAFSTVLLILIPVYVVLIMYYRTYWMKVVVRLFPRERPEALKEVMSLAIGTYYNFVKGMGIVYIIVGILNSIGLMALGIPHAILFGFIASILTVVPYVGIIIGSLLPITMAWITYDSIWYPLGIVAIFSFVQYLEANVIFPFAVGRRLNVNMLVMLIVIFAGGILWGVSGMILFVPFVGIVKLLADHNPKWKTLSMILGMENKQKK